MTSIPFVGKKSNVELLTSFMKWLEIKLYKTKSLYRMLIFSFNDDCYSNVLLDSVFSYLS